MKNVFSIAAALILATGAWNESRAALIPITVDQFSPSDPVITFETGTTGLPSVPGVTFLSTSSANNPWYGGNSDFTSFGPGFGRQAWANLSSGTTSGLGLDFASPVQAIGGYVARVVNSLNSPTAVTIELLDASGGSLGTATINLNLTVASPVFFGFTASAPIAETLPPPHTSVQPRSAIAAPTLAASASSAGSLGPDAQ